MEVALDLADKNNYFEKVLTPTSQILKVLRILLRKLALIIDLKGD